MAGFVHAEEFLGLQFCAGSVEEAARLLLSEDAQSRFRYVVTPNVQHMVALLENHEEIGPLYANAWRIYCDSRILRRLARLFGRHLAVVPGSDLTLQLLSQANQRCLKIVLIGPSQEDGAAL